MSKVRFLYGDLLSKSCKFAVVYKPAGLLLQSAKGDLSLERILLKHRNKVFFPHQLDKDASGLQVVAFNKSYCAALNESIAKREWVKKYRILTQVRPSTCGHKGCKIVNPIIDRNMMPLQFPLQGELKEEMFKKEGTIRTVLVRNTTQVQNAKDLVTSNKGCSCSKTDFSFVDKSLLFSSVSNDHFLSSSGKKAISHFVFEGLVPHKNESIGNTIGKDDQFALFTVTTETGRQHQLRSHFSDIGLPIVGDPLYNNFHISKIMLGVNELKWDFDNLTRSQWLHPRFGLGLQASFLEFPYPVLEDKKGEKVTVSCEIPEEWK